ncbi:HAMP domain-containing protein [Chromobacterium phragmitis]|uniref:ATP-binding protein n=1 Tax=Chromobacterium amazonense TaxID=1382803 RepID=UPI0021B84436|nr:ATP-binding protein [Chromobacterium amazonense]MBM2883741.1 HAMP domain-containing protein [Chromobacterium amazonense]
MPFPTHALRARLRHSIRARLIAMTCLIVVGVVSALTLVFAMAAASMLRQASERQLAQGLEQSAALMSNFLAVRESNLTLWAANPLSEAMFNDPALAAVFAPSLRNYFANARAHEPWIAHILLLRNNQLVYDDSGTLQYTPGAPSVASWLRGLPDGGVSVLNLKRLDGGSDRYALVLKRPLLKEGSASQGAFIALVLDLDQVQRALFERMHIGGHGFVAISASLPDGGVAVPTRIAGNAESLADFHAVTSQLRRAADLPEQFRSLVIRRHPLQTGPLTLIGVASRDDIREPVAQLILYSGLFGLLALAIGTLGAILYSERLTKPILDLARAALALKQGNLTDPIACASEDEIGQLAQSLESSRQALAGQVEALESRVRQRTRDLLQKSEEVARLLDNSGQGFLSFGADLTVHPGYSRECTRIFGREVQGLPLPELLAPDDAGQREFVAKTLRLALDSVDNDLRRDAYLNLLPAEYQLGEQVFRAEYRLLSGDQMMLILTDVSAQKKLQARLASEQLRLAFIVNALENRDDLLEMLRDFDDFRRCALPNLLNFQPDAKALLAELFRRVHTFKGLFAQACLPTLPRALHELESRLGPLRERETDVNDIKLALGQTDLGAALEADLAVLREKLGPDYLDSERLIQVPAPVLDDLQAEVRQTCGPDSRLAALVRQLRFAPISRMIAPHFKAAEELALRQGKPLAPLACEGDDPLVDPLRYGAFCKTLIHVFRNAVDHGIEDADTRLLADKSELAAIRCHISASAETLTIAISDDGQGIDPAAVRAAAIDKGLISSADASNMNDQETLRLVLADGLSTVSAANAVSGRGVGLSAAYQALLRLGGELRIESSIGQGTRMSFILPYEAALRPQPPPRSAGAGGELLQTLAQLTADFCRGHLDMAVALDGDGRRLAAADLLEFTAMVPLRSGVDIAMGISVDRPLLLEMARRFEPDCADEEIAGLADSVGAEIANTIVGKITPYLTHLSRHVDMGTPEVVEGAARGRFNHMDCRGISGHGAAGRFIVFCLPLTAADVC